MSIHPKLSELTIVISDEEAAGILRGAYPFEILLALSEIDNWVILSKQDVGEIFVASERQSFNLIHWLEKGDNFFTIKVCNSSPGPYNTVLRYRLADQKWKILLALHRSANVPCVVSRNLSVFSPVDFTRERPQGYPAGG